MRVMKEPAERKRDILHAAIRVFAQKGYEKTSITDIAKELNISQGLCYRYFPSKEAIYDAAIEEYAEDIVQGSLKKPKQFGKTLHEQILLMSGRMDPCRSAEKGQADLYALFHHPGSERLHQQLFFRVAQKLIPHLAQVLEAAKQRGEIAVSDPQAAAYFVVFGQMGMLMDNNIPQEEKTARIQTCLLELLRV